MTVPLRRGDLLPKLRVPPPGPRSREAAARLAAGEAPVVSTVGAGGEPSLVWAEARGANVLDADGNRFVDLTAGFAVAGVGHRHPAVVKAVRAQAGRLLHGLGDVHAHPSRARLAGELARRLPVDDPRIYFATSGAEAVEIALKTAWLATGRAAVVAFEPAYHGLTLGALAVTSRPEFRRPFAAHLSPHVRRLPYGCPPSEVAAALAPGDAAAVILEPIAGREGILVPPAGWLGGVAEACRKTGTLLIADEIFTGFGRTGRWFAVDHEGVRPDLLCCGKALGGGLPIALTAGRRELMEAWRRAAEQGGGEAVHTSTFLASPLACAAALASLEVLAADDLPARAGALGEAVGRRLGAWRERFPQVRDVRGRGLMWGVELASRHFAYRVAGEAFQRGVLMLAGGPEGRVAQITPPLVITERQLEDALDRVEAALAATADSGGEPSERR